MFAARLREAHEEGDLPYLRALDRYGLLDGDCEFGHETSDLVVRIVARCAVMPIERGRPIPGVWITAVRRSEHRQVPAGRSPDHQAMIDRHKATYVNCGSADPRACGWRWQIAGTIKGTNRAKANPLLAEWVGMIPDTSRWHTEAPAPLLELCSIGLMAKVLNRPAWVTELARRMLVDFERRAVEMKKNLVQQKTIFDPIGSKP